MLPNIKKCINCNNEFKPYSRRSKYCSKRCSEHQKYLKLRQNPVRLQLKYKKIRERRNLIYRLTHPNYKQRNTYKRGPKKIGSEWARVINKKFGLSVEQYQLLLDNQHNVCAICKLASDKKRLAVDHDHVSGTIRGLLCTKCNLGIGYFKDDIGRLNSAISYLTMNREGKTTSKGIPQ